MVLAAGTPVNVDGGVVNEGTFHHIANYKGLGVYNDNPNTRGEARVFDISSSSLVINSEAVISPGNTSGLDSAKLQNLKAIVAFGDANDSSKPKARVLTIGGTTVTPQTLSSAFEANGVSAGYIRIGSGINTLALVAYRTATDGMRYCRLAISGNTVTPGTPVTASTDGFPTDIIGLTADYHLVMFRRLSDGAPAFQIVDINTGITEGTVSVLGGYTLDAGTNFGPQQLARLGVNKAVAAFRPNSGGLRTVTVNTSGTTISSYGTVFAPTTGTSDPRITDISSTKVAYSAEGGSPNRRFTESLTISGDIITADGDGVSISDNAGGPQGIALLINTKLVVMDIISSDSNSYGTLITGAPPVPVSFGITESAGGIPGSI